MRRTLMMICAALAMALLAAACTNPKSLEPSALSSASDQTTMQPQPTPSTSSVGSATSVSEPATTPTTDDLFRLAPRSESILSVRYFDDTGSYFSGHNGNYVQGLDGPLVEILDLFEHGLVFQRSWEDNVIWTTENGPRELLIAAENQRLELEGGVLADGDEERPIVYYQRHTRASPEQTESSLRSFDPISGEVIVIALTGGWEAGARFSYLTGGKAVALSNTEGFDAMYVINLDTDRNVNVFDLPPLCPELAEARAFYSHATFVGDEILGDRQIFNTHDGVVDQWGFYLLDPDTCEEKLIETLAWDNGEWYIESFVGSIVNLRTTPDVDGKPAACAGT